MRLALRSMRCAAVTTAALIAGLALEQGGAHRDRRERFAQFVPQHRRLDARLLVAVLDLERDQLREQLEQLEHRDDARLGDLVRMRIDRAQVAEVPVGGPAVIRDPENGRQAHAGGFAQHLEQPRHRLHRGDGRDVLAERRARDVANSWRLTKRTHGIRCAE
jgi:hypothetical protein